MKYLQCAFCCLCIVCVYVWRFACVCLYLCVCLHRREIERARLSCCAALIIAFQCWINIQHPTLRRTVRVNINLCNLNTYKCVIGIPLYINQMIPREGTAHFLVPIFLFHSKTNMKRRQLNVHYIQYSAALIKNHQENIKWSTIIFQLKELTELMTLRGILVKDVSTFSSTLKQDCWGDRVIKLPVIQAPFQHHNTQAAVATAASRNQRRFYRWFPREVQWIASVMFLLSSSSSPETPALLPFNALANAQTHTSTHKRNSPDKNLSYALAQV